MAALVLGAVIFSLVLGNGWLLVASLLARRGRHACREAGVPRLCARGEPLGRDRSLAVVRPLRGTETGAELSNRLLLQQRYAGPLEFIFVASRPDDSGLALARARHAEDARVCFAITPCAVTGATDKARNMAWAWQLSEAPFVAFCDADIALAPDTIARCMRPFDAPEVGAVFAPALHAPRGLLARVLTQISAGDKLIGVGALERLGKLDILEGGLMIVRRSAVEAAGGIELIRRSVADDLRLGTALRKHGVRLRLGPPILHRQSHRSAVEWAAQYHRWMVCQRSEKPGLLWFQILLNPVLVGGLACAAFPASRLLWGLFAAGMASRIALTAAVERSFLRPHGVRFGWQVVLRPLADLLQFAFCLSAFVLPWARWGEHRYRLERRGQIASVEAAAPTQAPQRQWNA